MMGDDPGLAEGAELAPLDALMAWARERHGLRWQLQDRLRLLGGRAGRGKSALAAQLAGDVATAAEHALRGLPAGDRGLMEQVLEAAVRIEDVRETAGALLGVARKLPGGGRRCCSRRSLGPGGSG